MKKEELEKRVKILQRSLNIIAVILIISIFLQITNENNFVFEISPPPVIFEPDITLNIDSNASGEYKVEVPKEEEPQPYLRLIKWQQ